MISKNISRYIFFGTSLRYLQDVEEGLSVHGSNFVLHNIASIFSYLDEFNLVVTKRVSYELKMFTEELKKTDKDHELTNQEAEKLSRIMTDLRKTLIAEAEGNVAFIVTNKRVDVNKLLSDVPALMAKNVYNLIPKIAQYDFRESGKCLAFERSTAAAFHLLRGTEAVLRHFYCSIVKRKRVKPLLWGNMIGHLRNRKTNRPSTTLLDNLDNIRNNYRNPTQHPEAIYDIDRAQDLWGICSSAVNEMVISKYWE